VLKPPNITVTTPPLFQALVPVLACYFCSIYRGGQNSTPSPLRGGWADAASSNGWSEEDIDKVIEEATSGDYENLLRVLVTHSTPE